MGLYDFNSSQSNGPISPGLTNSPKKRLRYTGEFLNDYGYNLQNDAIGGLDDMDAQLSGELASGRLPPAVERAYNLGYGRIADDGARSRNSFAADLLQTARRTGGSLDPNAALDYQVGREADIDQQSFDARNALAMNEAETGLQHTSDLRQTILDIRKRKLGSGEATTTAGISARAAALDPRKHNGQNTTAVINGIASIISSAAGGH